MLGESVASSQSGQIWPLARNVRKRIIEDKAKLKLGHLRRGQFLAVSRANPFVEMEVCLNLN